MRRRTFQLPQLREVLEGSAKRECLPRPDNAMRLIFSDESGIGDDSEPILVVAAIIVDGDHQWPLIEIVKQNILEKYVREESRADFEFKDHRLFAQLGKGNNEIILREFLQTIVTFDLPIVWAAVDRSGMANRYATKGLACSKEVMQNLAFSVAATQAEYLMRKLWSNEREIWLADETRANLKMKASLRELQTKAPFDDEELTKFEHIIDTIFFGSSHLSTGIQLADACNFFIKKHFMGDQSAERFFRIVHPFMMNRDDAPLYGPGDIGDIEGE